MRGLLRIERPGERVDRLGTVAAERKATGYLGGILGPIVRLGVEGIGQIGAGVELEAVGAGAAIRHADEEPAGSPEEIGHLGMAGSGEDEGLGQLFGRARRDAIVAELDLVDRDDQRVGRISI